MNQKNNQKTPLVWMNVKRRVNDLLPCQKNPRQISDEQLEALKRSLVKFNLVETPAITPDNKIISGHQRLKCLQLLGRGDEIIDCRMPNRALTKNEFEQYLITANAVRGDWDFEKLKCFDVEMLLTVGFNETELAHIWDDNLETYDDDFDVDKEIIKIIKPKTKLGDLYALGPNRLLCADSTDPASLKKLFGSQKASMIYSDPVYNINIDYNAGLGGKSHYGGNVNDKRSDEDYEKFLKQSLENALSVAKDDIHCFYWCDESYIWLIQKMFRELDLTNRRVCVWLKNGFNPTPKVGFNKCFEPCVYSTRGNPYLAKGIENLNEVMNREVTTGNRLLDDVMDLINLWLVKRLASDEIEHATSKPPTLHEKAIRRCTRPGDIILDSFLGSGSTLIAAEQLKRRCYGVEFEPIFCDVIIKRYETLTKNKVKKIN